MYSISLFFVKSMFFFSLFDIILIMKENTKDKIYTFFTVFVIAIILVVGIINWWPVLKRQSSLKERKAALEAEIEEVRKENLEKSESIKRFKTKKEQVEAVARQDHRVYPGEVVFVFPDKDKK